MADCGATGSTLDRAARALFGANDAKAAASLMGHAVAALGGGASQQQMPLLVATPDTIMLPQTQSQQTMKQQQHHLKTPEPVHSLEQQQSPLQYQSLQQHQHTQQHQFYNPHQQPQQAPQFQQQHAHLQMMQQQQQFMMMQQQQLQLQLMAQQQHHHLQQQQNLSRVTHEQKHDAEYHDGVVQGATIQELSAAWAETVDDIQQEQDFYDGNVQGATIEELSAAWAEAQADYEELEAAVNLASGYQEEEHVTPEYEFLNPLADVTDATETPEAPSTDWMEQGMRHFAQGELQEAVRDFETELQQHNMDNATAWRMLGRCHAENDQDRMAIVCLEQAVDRDPYNQEARLALGVSYVNELNHAKALEHLKAWITHNPKYSQLDIGEDLYGAGSADNTFVSEPGFDEVQRLLLSALEFDASDAADVLGALGVVYNVSRDYDAAIDAFKRAIAINGDDYQLYNRLGATLANCSKSEDALPAYKRAIELKPKFTRAWLNMAISHANLQNFGEASRCYLQTLSLNPAATHCWSYLRVALSSGHYWELLPYAAAMDLDSFHAHFDFI
ncbi:hypothetical protein MPSEU_000386500 [Mayamaea pseudoterrestris]|nr:hypothetical protein MPSEU_000386500 [Mayamaea pseudoterrestris]